MKRRIDACQLGIAFLRLGFTTYGGAASAAIGEEFVNRREWLTHEEFLTFRSIALIAPGPNSPNLAILIGRHLAGAPGAAFAFCATTMPGVAIILLLGIIALNAHSPLGGALRGCAAAAVGLTFANAVDMSLRTVRSVSHIGIIAVTFLAVMVLHAPLWLTLAILVPISMVLAKAVQRHPSVTSSSQH